VLSAPPGWNLFDGVAIRKFSGGYAWQRCRIDSEARLRGPRRYGATAFRLDDLLAGRSLAGVAGANAPAEPQPTRSVN